MTRHIFKICLLDGIGQKLFLEIKILEIPQQAKVQRKKMKNSKNLNWEFFGQTKKKIQNP